MTGSAPSTDGFDSWLRRITPDDDGAEVSAEWSAWLRALYDSAGPLPRADVETRARAAQRAAAEAALAAVVGDVERARGRCPTMQLVKGAHGRLRVAYQGVQSSGGEPPGGLWAVNDQAALVEVAGEVLGIVADDEQAVPLVCPVHQMGLHARLDDGLAVWWCEPAGHAVAPVGRLPGPTT